MKVKRFLEKDSRTAMARARAEFGADAVILSNKSVGGQVELVAAIDLDEAAFEHSDALAEHKREHGSGAAPVNAATLAELQRELSYLRSMIEGKLSQMSWRDMAGQPSAKAAAQARLAKLGLSSAVSGPVLDILPAQGDVEEYWQLALQMLVGRLPVQAQDRLLDKGGVVALMGPTGVGKTTIVAKLAARSILRYGKRDVALVTTDCYRVGGQEQLQVFAKYLDIPCVVAPDIQKLQSALTELQSKRLVLIDTAGMSQRDPRFYQQYKSLQSAGRDLDSYLVLSATAQLQTLEETVGTFGKGDLAGVIVSKIDEAVALGSVLEVLIENELPLAYVSDGQKVPNDLSPAAARWFVEKAAELIGDNNWTNADDPVNTRPTQSATV